MYGIVANVMSDRVLRTGAKVWIHYCNGDAGCPVVSGISKGGRAVQKYTHYKRLENFRVAWVPEHMRDRVMWMWDDRSIAEDRATHLSEVWTGVRHFNRDGTVLMRDGVSEGEAWARYRVLSGR